MTCTNCGVTTGTERNLCTSCGSKTPLISAIKINESPRVCDGCGASLEHGSAICAMCGRDNLKPIISTLNGQLNIETRNVNLGRLKPRAGQMAAVKKLRTQFLSGIEGQISDDANEAN